MGGGRGREGITVGVAGVTGDKCAACVLLIGTRAYTYNQWLNLGAQQSQPATPNTKDNWRVQSVPNPAHPEADGLRWDREILGAYSNCMLWFCPSL